MRARSAAEAQRVAHAVKDHATIADPIGMGSRLVAKMLAGMLLVLSLPASAEIYKWVDGQGRMHFAQELHNVPERFRSQAERNALSAGGPSPVQTYSPPANVTRPRPRPAAPRTWGHVGRGVYEVPVERAGRQLRVMVRVNDAIEAPFYIDTGASRVLVPRWVVEEADIDLDGAPTMVAGTANGLVEVPVVTLDSVELHGARVERVPAAVSDSMQVGLLGLSFLNHFEYAVDPAAGVVTLRENDLGRVGVIPGEVD